MKQLNERENQLAHKYEIKKVALELIKDLRKSGVDKKTITRLYKKLPAMKDEGFFNKSANAVLKDMYNEIRKEDNHLHHSTIVAAISQYCKDNANIPEKLQRISKRAKKYLKVRMYKNVSEMVDEFMEIKNEMERIQEEELTTHNAPALAEELNELSTGFTTLTEEANITRILDKEIAKNAILLMERFVAECVIPNQKLQEILELAKNDFENKNFVIITEKHKSSFAKHSPEFQQMLLSTENEQCSVQ
jgi:altronate dehydratase